MADHAKDMAIRDTDWSTVPVAAIANLLRAVGDGAPVQAFCEEVGLDLAPLAPDVRVPYRQLADLYDTAARWTGDPWFGLHVGANIDVRSFDLIGHLVLTAASLDQVFEVLVRYLPLWTTSAGFQLERSRGALEIVWSYADPSAPLRRHDCEMSVMAAISAAGLRDAGRRPREIHFRHPPPADASEHHRLLCAPVRFGMPRNAIVCDAATAALPVASADPGLHALLRELAEQRLSARPRPRSIVDDATAAIARLLPSGDVQLSTVARALGVGTRTLQRRLIGAGTTFSAVLAAVRRDRATHALAHSDRSVGEVATELGYGSSSELHRALRRWVGVGPRAYRRARR